MASVTLENVRVESVTEHIADSHVLAQRLINSDIVVAMRERTPFDADLFHPRAKANFYLPRPIFLTVGRLAVEKNLEAFLTLDLPGTKLIIGNGPARAALSERHADALFVGSTPSTQATSRTPPTT